MPEKIMANRTDMKVVNAENVATLDSALKVRGREKIKEMMAVITENTMVHLECPVIVLRYSAPTRQCSPWDEVSMNFVIYGRLTYLNEGIVQKEHDRGQVPGNPGVPEQVLPDITHITNMGMTQAKFPVRLLAWISNVRRGRTYQIVSEV